MNFKSYILFLLSGLIFLKANCQDFSNIQFVENKGQWNHAVKYMGQVSNGAFFVTGNGFTILQHNGDDLNKLHEITHNHQIPTSDFKTGSRKNITIRSHAYSVIFLNGNPNAEIVADKPLTGGINYFIGNDPSKWASDCKIYQGVTVKNVYPNVDVRYFSDKGTVKYDIIVNPGGHVSDIALKYDGVDKLDVKNKELVIGTSVGNLKELEPYTFQYNEKGRNEIGNKYKIKDRVVRFNIKDYDPNTTLIIDPTLIFCSFTGSSADNWGFTATYGPDGSMFGGGIVFNQGFPVSNGAYQTAYAGGSSGGFENGFDIGLIKLSPDGSTRIYATYLGGGGNEFPQSLIVDNQGELIVAGRTDSNDFPGVQMGSGGSFDIIVTKLNAAGTKLIGSVKLGGSGDDGANITPYGGGANSLQRNYGDEARSEVNLDGAGNIYVASCSQSNSGATPNQGFPIVNGFQKTNNGGNTYHQDGVVLKFNPDLSALLFSTFLGGTGNDAAYVLSVNPFNGNIYVAGGTESTDFPGVPSSGVISSSNNGNIDGFVSIISNDGSTLIKTTYIGTGGIDQVYGIQFDKFGFPYIMGQTTGQWTVVNAPWSQANGKQFISKMQPDLSSFVYSTMFGSGEASPNISPVAFLVDRCENVYVSGWGGMIGDLKYPSAGTQGLTVTADALKKTTDVNPSSGLGEDFYFFVLKRDATAQLYGSFFGQNGPLVDHVDGGTSRFDRNGVIYEAICANCGSEQSHVRFPTTPNSWAPSKPASANCNLAMVKIAFNLAGVRGGVLSSINGRLRDTSGCIPITVDFIDTVQVAKRYYWDFGDGSPQETTTLPNNSHTFANIGVFRVMMIAVDSNTCNISDTSYVNIKAGNLKALLSFTPAKLNPCDSFKYEFINTSVAPAARPFTSTTFGWDFGDGTVIKNAGPETVFHNYASPGTYNVKLILHDDAYCNDPDTITTALRVAVLVKARIQTPPFGCVPYNAVFENTSDAGSQFFWDFGDGTTSTDVSPTHLYNLPGTYTVTLLAIDTATCNKRDSTSTTIQVFTAPTANFTAAPQPPVTNVPISFSNLSTADAVSFKWLFGDGDSLLTNSRNVVQHEYNSTGTFNVCLVATNRAGCASMYCAPVVTLIEPAVDVPNAFTPQRGDNNIVYVRGFGFAKMKFTIYDRWGREVFVSTDKHIGWDGKYKGQLLPMDVFAYTLSVEFTNGTKTTKTGDITLIR